jgi:hypothetical protein
VDVVIHSHAKIYDTAIWSDARRHFKLHAYDARPG